MGGSEAGPEAAVVIVRHGSGSKALKIAKHSGVPDAAVFLGVGTAKNRILEFIELTDIRKEIVLLIAGKTVIDAAVKSMDDEFVFHKPNHGIAFTVPLRSLLNAAGHYTNKSNREADGVMYNSILAVVERGMAEPVMEAATEAGAKGGTIIKARGAGSYEAGKLFHMDIEPEKEIVLILAEAAIAEKITASVYARLESEGSHGTVFSLNVNTVYGVTQ